MKKILKYSLLIGGIAGIAVTSLQAEPSAVPPPLPKVKAMTPGYTGKFSWGMFTEQKKLKDLPRLKSLSKQYPADHTVEVIRYITPGGIGEAEGLSSGDIVVEKGPYSSVTSRPGEKVKVKVWRANAAKLEKLTLTLPQYYQIKYEAYTQPEAAEEFEKTLPPDWQTYAKLLQQPPIREHLDDLLQRLTDIDSLTDAYRLPVFRYLIRNPFRLEQVSRSWADKVSAVKDWPELLPLSRYMLEFDVSAQPDPVKDFLQKHPLPGESANVGEIVEFYTQVLKRCQELHQQAFRKLAPADMQFVRDNMHQAFESICQYHMLSYDPDTDRARRTIKIFELLNRIDRQALWQQSRMATLLGNEKLVSRLQKLLKGRKGILCRKNTTYGTVIIAGESDDYHRDNAALIIDLGGNDVYLNNQASPAGNICTSVIVDCAGNDYYSSTDAYGQGSGILGVGILLDMAGDDNYAGLEMAQASAFGGIGILYDRAGNDTYRAVRMSQAAAYFGAGLLIDVSGDDRYEIQHFGQALGSVRGAAVLLDRQGNDFYLCKGKQQTSYNTRGHFDGWGQGIGFGVRPFASGGIGILLDQKGRDRYEGGTFTQGGGYYYGFGICSDQGSENDFYLGTRYSQGFAAHQALGAFIERGGNDIYRTLHCVSLGISWDETVVLFADDSGDDDYNSGTGACSYSAVHQNGICFFFDRSGNDRYAGSRVLPRSSNNYHLGHSLGIFIDSGGGKDHYIKRKNNTAFTEAGDHIFIDK